ncbi:MAG: glycosyltransferase family 2 protein [Anaerolineae bacterium]|nr:glycosyltransferase family 2 protein [Anaerolineae bacterium]
MTRSRILISVLNWNGAERTIHCVRQLQQQHYPNREILIVDNASRQESVAQLREALPDVRLIISAQNLGYAGGHALALKVAQQEGFDCFWMLNTDIELQPRTLDAFMAAYQQHGLALYGSPPLEKISGTSLTDYPILMHHKYYDEPYREIIFQPQTTRTYGEVFPDDAARQVVALSGSSLFFPLELVRQYGFMDEGFFMYSEEVDYCFRLRQAGVKRWMVPAAYILHESEGTSRGYSRVRDIIRYYRQRNQIIRIRRWGNTGDLIKAIVKDLLLGLAALRHGRQGLRTLGFHLGAIRDGLRGTMGKTYPPEDYV